MDGFGLNMLGGWKFPFLIKNSPSLQSLSFQVPVEPVHKA
jgi:hypothetical protein